MGRLPDGDPMLLAGLSWATHVYNFQIPVWKVVNIDPSTVLAELSNDVVDVLRLEYCTYSIPVHPPSVLTPYIVRHTYHGLVLHPSKFNGLIRFPSQGLNRPGFPE